MKENGRIFLKAAAAGITIGIGGAVYLTLENRVIGAVLFGVGLYMIVPVSYTHLTLPTTPYV